MPLPRLPYLPTSRPVDMTIAALPPSLMSYAPVATEKPMPRDVSSKFGLRLRELRLQHNMTQLRMATVFGIDRSFISDVERGRKSISLPMLEVIALGMRISLSELLRDL